LGLFGGNVENNLNYLEMTPRRIHGHEMNDNGLIDVLVPRFKNKFFKKFFIPSSKSPYIRANLDEFGSETWKLIDGQHRVSAIADILNEKFGEKIHPVLDRLTMFLTNLYRNGFISFIEIERDK
jgi:hypothetical protein